MNDDYIDLIEPTPKLTSKRCRIISFLIRLLLQFTTYVTAFIVWYLFDIFIAFFALILSFIIVGIIRSKLRNNVIPQSQREYQYNDQGIADWYTAKELCDDK